MWILIESLALAGLLSALKFLGLVLGLAIGLPFFFAITLPNVARRLSRSRLVTRAYENRAYIAIKCRRCTFGAQYFDGKALSWGPIPHRVRMVVATSKWFGPPQANIRSCPYCNGQGHVPHEIRPSEGRNEVEWPPTDGGPLWQDAFVELDAPESEPE